MFVTVSVTIMRSYNTYINNFRFTLPASKKSLLSSNERPTCAEPLSVLTFVWC